MKGADATGTPPRLSGGVLSMLFVLDGRFFCWACELWYGDESAPLLPSQLCAGCKKARGQ